MPDLIFASFEATWMATTPMKLPTYAGSTLRGAFGRAFRKIACTMRSLDCKGCLLLARCVYPNIFETKEDDKTTEATRPFVIEPPLNGKHIFAPTDSFSAGLLLFGQAIDYLPYFLVSFRELGLCGLGSGRGKCELTEVTAVHPLTGVRMPIFTVSDGRIRDFDYRQSATEIIGTAVSLPTDQLTIVFRTAARLKHQGHYIDHVSFPILIARLLDRMDALSGSFGTDVPWLNGKSARELLKLSNKVRVKAHPAYWKDWTRYSARQKTRLKMGGVIGRVTYTGDLTPFLPLLVLGQFTHVGKGAVFGLGKYEIEKPMKKE